MIAEVIAWLTANTVAILTALTLGAAIVGVLLAARGLGAQLCRNASTRYALVLGRALARTRLWFMAAVAAEIVASYAHAPRDVANTVHFVFVVAAALQAALFARELILGGIEARAEASGGLGSAINIIRLLVTVALFAVASILILSNLGVDVTGLVAGLGIGGIAIGLAAQGIFRDLFAALAILFDAPFRVGDLIRFDNTTARVEAIGLKTTRLRSVDGELIVMSNNKLLELQLHNYAGLAERRVVLVLPLNYRSAPESLAALPATLAQVVAGVPGCRFDSAGLLDFTDTALRCELRFFVTGGATERDAARHRVMVEALSALAATGVTVHAVPPPD